MAKAFNKLPTVVLNSTARLGLGRAWQPDNLLTHAAILLAFWTPSERSQRP